MAMGDPRSFDSREAREKMWVFRTDTFVVGAHTSSRNGPSSDIHVCESVSVRRYVRAKCGRAFTEVFHCLVTSRITKL